MDRSRCAFQQRTRKDITTFPTKRLCKDLQAAIGRLCFLSMRRGNPQRHQYSNNKHLYQIPLHPIYLLLESISIQQLACGM